MLKKDSLIPLFLYYSYYNSSILANYIDHSFRLTITATHTSSTSSYPGFFKIEVDVNSDINVCLIMTVQMCLNTTKVVLVSITPSGELFQARNTIPDTSGFQKLPKKLSCYVCLYHQLVTCFLVYMFAYLYVHFLIPVHHPCRLLASLFVCVGLLWVYYSWYNN